MMNREIIPCWSAEHGAMYCMSSACSESSSQTRRRYLWWQAWMSWRAADTEPMLLGVSCLSRTSARSPTIGFWRIKEGVAALNPVFFSSRDSRRTEIESTPRAKMLDD